MPPAAACATASAPPCPDATPATITGYQRRQRMPLPPRLPRIRQQTPQRLPQGHRIRCRPGRQVAADAAGQP
jgi:hypothetical protein